MNVQLYSGGKVVTDKVLLRKFSTEDIGIFETLQSYNGKIFQEEEHLVRLGESAKTAGFKKSIDAKKIREDLKSALLSYHRHCEGQAAILRPGPKQSQTCLPARQGLLRRPAGPPRNDIGKDLFLRLTLWADHVFIMIGERKHPKELYRKGVKLRTSPVRRSLSNAAFPETKTNDYQNGVLASLEPRPDDIYEWVFLSQQGYVTEVRIGNLFIVQKSPAVLLTPPSPGILNGVTRRVVIKCALEAGIPVQEIPLTRHEIYNAGEAFLTNTSWEILPVSELDSRRIGTKMPGPLTVKLHRMFKEKVMKECRPS